MHDRDIANRIDDSVVRIMAGRPRLIRRARGYAPSPTKLPKGFEDAPEISPSAASSNRPSAWSRTARRSSPSTRAISRMRPTFDDYQKNMALYRALYDHRPRVFAAGHAPGIPLTKLAKEQGARRGAARRAASSFPHRQLHGGETALRSTRRRCSASCSTGWATAPTARSGAGSSCARIIAVSSGSPG